MNRNQAAQIAEAIAAIRPDWTKTSLLTLMAEFAHREPRDVFLALAWLAYDRDTKTPGRLRTDGPHWHISRLAGIPEPTHCPPTAAEVSCPIHLDRLPCKGCAADAKAASEFDPLDQTPPRLPGETIRQWAARIAQGDE